MASSQTTLRWSATNSNSWATAEGWGASRNGGSIAFHRGVTEATTGPTLLRRFTEALSGFTRSAEGFAWLKCVLQGAWVRVKGSSIEKEEMQSQRHLLLPIIGSSLLEEGLVFSNYGTITKELFIREQFSSCFRA